MFVIFCRTARMTDWTKSSTVSAANQAMNYRHRASLDQKNPRVRKIRVRNSGAGNGCVNFMDARKNAFFLQEKQCPKNSSF